MTDPVPTFGGTGTSLAAYREGAQGGYSQGLASMSASVVSGGIVRVTGLPQ
jgi:hypothetical protein